MNHNTVETDPQTLFYDLDYPWPEDDAFAQVELDPFVGFPVKADIEFVLKIAALAKPDGTARVLDLCCGTGRLSIPLARLGYHVVAIDISEGQLERMRWRVARESEEVRARIQMIHLDATKLDMVDEFEFVVIGFNSLNLIDTAAAQRSVIASAARALKPGGLFLADMLNPLQSSPFGMSIPVPMAARHDAATGRRYTKFGVPGAISAHQRQVVMGWYDIVEPDFSLKRMHFEMKFRFIFPHEFVLLTELCGLDLRMISGDYQGGSWNAGARKLIGAARKPGGSAADAEQKVS